MKNGTVTVGEPPRGSPWYSRLYFFSLFLNDFTGRLDFRDNLGRAGARKTRKVLGRPILLPSSSCGASWTRFAVGGCRVHYVREIDDFYGCSTLPCHFRRFSSIFRCSEAGDSSPLDVHCIRQRVTMGNKLR